MVVSGAIESSSRRRTLLVVVGSLLVHAGAAALVLQLAPHSAAPPASQLLPFPIHLVDVVDVAVPPPSAPVDASRQRASSSEGALGRRGHATPQHIPSGAPVVTRSRVDLAVSYDDPNNFAPRTGDTTDGRGPGTGQQGLGLGAGGAGFDNANARLPPPPPPAASQARPARPKQDYQWTRFHRVLDHVGKTIDVALKIDARGRVIDAQVVKGVLLRLDEEAIEMAQKFEFEPALDDAGTPIASSYLWHFKLVDNRADPTDGAAAWERYTGRPTPQ